MSEEQRLFVEAADRFVQDRLNSASSAAPDESARWQQYAQMGWLGVGMPEALGGYLGFAEVTLLFERIGRAGIVDSLLDNVVLCGPLLAQHGSVSQQELAQQMTLGQARLALAAREAQQRYDWHEPATVLGRDGRLNGTKCLVAAGEQASHVLVVARDQRNDDGLTTILLPANREGMAWRHYRGYDDRPWSDLSLEQVQVNTADIVGEPGQARAALEAAFDRAYVAMAAEAAGAMQRIHELTMEYSKTRKQFGRVIAGNQAYQHQLVDMYVALEELRGLARYASEMLINSPKAGSRWASAAKAYSANDGRLIGESGVQLHGAIGMTEEYAVGGYYKRLAAMANLMGDAEWHWLRMRELDKEEA